MKRREKRQEKEQEKKIEVSPKPINSKDRKTTLWAGLSVLGIDTDLKLIVYAARPADEVL